MQLSRGAAGDTLTVRGNFRNIKTQLTQPSPSTATLADLGVLAGTAGRFAVGDYVVLSANGVSEHVRVTTSNQGGGYIRTESRLFNYPAGTTVDQVITVRYLVGADSSLRMVESGRNVVLLDKGVTQFAFKLIGFNGQVAANPPWVPMDVVQFVGYTLNIRIPKVGGNYLDRTVSGKILLRNI